MVQKTFYESRVDWVAPKQNPTPTVRSVQGNILFCFPYHVLDMPQPNKTFFPKRCSLSDYNFIRVSIKAQDSQIFLSVNPAFSKDVYRQYKLKIVEGLIIQPKIGLQ